MSGFLCHLLIDGHELDIGERTKERQDRVVLWRRPPHRAPVLRLIDHRAGGKPMPALRFAAAAMGRGVSLRPAKSKDAPRNFHVGHPRYTQIVVYAHPRPGEIQLDRLLPGTHPTYDLATARDEALGISLIVRDDRELDAAMRLLEDAIGLGWWGLRSLALRPTQSAVQGR